MKFFSKWQPLRDEDAHTALVFGFFRHAPTSAGLDLWLTRVLGREVKASVLTPASFWPSLVSVVPGSSYTEPELVFTASDHQPLTVVIEVKPGYAMHALEQIRREIVDVANVHGPTRIACVMVGADLSRPEATGGWAEEVEAAIAEHVSHPVDVELHYSSFADAGRAVADVGARYPEWATYAEDVVAQLRRKGLMGYEGAPMLDDLQDLTISNAVEVFNRTIRAARHFYLLLHAQRGFSTLGLAAHDWNFRMLRDGRSEVPTQSESWFQTTVILSWYQHPALPDGEAAFVAFDLRGSGAGFPDILVGVGASQLGVYNFGDAVRTAETLTKGPFQERAAAGANECLYARRVWRPGAPDDDVQWAIEQLRESLAARATMPAPEPELG
jgi:hypothetical protein